MRIMDSYSSLSFNSLYLFMSIVWVSSIPCVPCTMGLNMLLIVPSTSVGKNMMQMPTAKGRNSGYTSIGSALARDCHTRMATYINAPNPAIPFATPSPHTDSSESHGGY